MAPERSGVIPRPKPLTKVEVLGWKSYRHVIIDVSFCMSYEYLESLVKKTIEAGKSWERSADSLELEFLYNLAKRPNVRLIGEIGFNAGLSSYAFLMTNPEACAYSFDLGEHDYVKPAKEYIDKISQIDIL